jgi:integrase
MGRRLALNLEERQLRVTQRARVGSLSDNRVSARTLERYRLAVHRFLDWMECESLEAATWVRLEKLLMRYIEELWATGEGKTLANNTLSGVQHYLSTRRQMPGAWALLTTWGRLEVPARAPPVSRDLALALAGEACEQGREDFATLILLAFHCYLRPSELLRLGKSTISLGRTGAGVLSLEWTKVGQQKGAKETVRVEDQLVLFWLRRRLVGRSSGALLLESSPYSFRKFLADGFKKLGVEHHGYMPYSLRRGGATHDFLVHRDIARCLFRGRWADVRTGRIYIMDGAARMAELQTSPAAAKLIRLGVSKLHHHSSLAGFSIT